MNDGASEGRAKNLFSGYAERSPSSRMPYEQIINFNPSDGHLHIVVRRHEER